METTTHHRKIELQSPHDLTHIESQIRTLARAKIDQNLPPITGPEGKTDELRSKVEVLVDAYVENVLRGVRANIWVNGLDVDVQKGVNGGAGGGEGQERVEFEVFDSRLKERLEGLTARKNLLVEQVSSCRRTAAGVAARRFREGFLGEERRGVEERERAEEMAGRVSREGMRGLVGLQEGRRLEEVRRNWESGVEGLGSLKGRLPETRARLERGVGVVGHFEGK